MTRRPLFIRLLCGCALLAFTGAARAQSNVITIAAGKLDISVGTIGGASGAQATPVLKNDLVMSGAFNLADPARTAYRATGSFTAAGLQGSLADAAGKPLFNRSFPGDWRQAVHAFADAIVEAATGQKGIASSQVVFVSAASGKKEVYLMDMDGANVRQLTRDNVISLGPKFSPGARKVAYTSYKSGYPDVWVIDLAGKVRHRVASFPGVNGGPAFSPDGGSLALILSLSGNTELYTLPAGGGSPTRLTRSNGTEASPTWSPDGASIAYVSDDRGSPQIYILPSSGGAPRRVNTFSSYSTEPDWSPDGAKLAYSIRAAGNSQIAVTTLQGGEQKLLTASGSHEHPSWARNSRHVVCASGGTLYLLDSLTRESIPVKNGLSRCSEPDCSR